MICIGLGATTICPSAYVSDNRMHRAYVLLLLLYTYVMPMYAQRVPACTPTLVQSKTNVYTGSPKVPHVPLMATGV